MTRTLTFPPGDDKAYAICRNAFVSGGDALYRAQNGARPNDVRRQEAKILKALKALALPEEDLVEGQPLPKPRLLPEGGTLTLEQGLWVLLEKYLEAAMVPTAVSDHYADLLDRVSAAEKQE
jgi:hypothetical protein